MASHTYQLSSFSPLPPGEELTVAGAITREGHILQLLFRLSGNIASLSIPRLVREPSRCDNLWQTTCCECFFRPRAGRPYHELNISPSGCWNLYHFSDYRTAMREELAITEFSSESLVDDVSFVLRGTLDLNGIVKPADVLEVGMCCVLEHRNGEKSYWALSHPGQQPDFHHPDGFVLEL